MSEDNRRPDKTFTKEEIDSVKKGYDKNNDDESMKHKLIYALSEYPQVKEIPLTKEIKIKVLDTFENLKWLLSKFNAQIKYNLMTRRREITIPGHHISPEDLENESLMRVHYLSTLNDMPTKLLNEHLQTIAMRNSYHPIVDCVKSKIWDGVKRLDSFVETIKSNDQKLSNKLIRTWMTAAIAAAHSIDGFTNHGAIVLQGDQGIGKTAWVKSLDPINCGAIKDGAILDPSYKDCVIALSQYWIVELGELDATYKSADIARIKSYITMKSDNIRNPYARLDQTRPRRTAYIATVNKSNYLVDDTGNRRWWTIEALEINYQHNFDMQQVWAEVYHEWKGGSLTYLNSNLQSEVNQLNEEHEQIDPLEEKLLSAFNWDTPLTKKMTVTEILEAIQWKPIDQKSANKVSRLLTKITGKKAIRNGKKGERMREVPANFRV